MVLFPPETATSPKSTPRSASAALAADARVSLDDGAVPCFTISSAVYALLAASCRDDAQQATRYADRAIELLRRAIARGFRRQDLIAENPGFTFLKSRADFRAVLDSLPRRVQGAIEGEAASGASSEWAVRSRPACPPGKCKIARWSGDAILIGSPRQPGDWVEFALPVPADGTYLAVWRTLSQPRGTEWFGYLWTARRRDRSSMDSAPVPSRSYAIHDATPPAVATELGTVHLRKGTATLRLEAVGKNEKSSGFSWGLDCIVLRPSSGAMCREPARRAARKGDGDYQREPLSLMMTRADHASFSTRAPGVNTDMVSPKEFFNTDSQFNLSSDTRAVSGPANIECAMVRLSATTGEGAIAGRS